MLCWPENKVVETFCNVESKVPCIGRGQRRFAGVLGHRRNEVC